MSPKSDMVTGNRAMSDQSTRPGTCRGPNCGKPIRWMVTGNKRFTPVNLDGTPHWETCPDAKWFRAMDEQRAAERKTRTAAYKRKIRGSNGSH